MAAIRLPARSFVAIFGSVAADGSEPVVPLTMFSANGRVVNLEAVVDTGFNGEIILPTELIRRLGYRYVGTAGGVLADGSGSEMDYCSGSLSWHGEKLEVVVLAGEGAPLVGMGLLEGSRLTVDAVPGGEVVIEFLQQVRRSEGLPQAPE